MWLHNGYMMFPFTFTFTAVELTNFDPVLVFQPSDEQVCTSFTIPDDNVASGGASLMFSLASYESQGAKVFLVTSVSLFFGFMDNDSELTDIFLH